ncbi:hypothetical protein EBZ39_07325 [bacterium]|nr:hypothetical protein [bacterium]
MDIQKVKNPDQISRSRGVVFQDPIKDRYRLNNAWERFNSRFEIAWGSTRLRSARQGFKGYDLGIHDLIGIRSYERTGEISRIVKERTGEPYLMGIELEIERVKDRERVGEILKRGLPDRHICVRDGSLASDGIEIVTSPLAPREIGRIPWYNLLRSLSRVGCISHDSGACGLHVSISRNYLKDRTWKGIRSMLSRDRSLFEALSRRTIGKAGSANGDPFYFCSFSPREGKYQALNLSKSAVCEFRFFRGTLSPASFIGSLEIVRSIVEYAKDRESRSDRVRLSAKSWIEYVRERGSFGMAWEYMRAHADRFLTTPRAPRVRAAGNRVASFVRDRSRGSMYQINSSGDLELESGYTSDRMIQSLCVGGSIQGIEIREYRIPIAWQNSTGLPQYVRESVERGTAPREIVIRSAWAPAPNEGSLENRGICFSYYRGGWGRRSALYSHAVTID